MVFYGNAHVLYFTDNYSNQELEICSTMRRNNRVKWIERVRKTKNFENGERLNPKETL